MWVVVGAVYLNLRPNNPSENVLDSDLLYSRRPHTAGSHTQNAPRHIPRVQPLHIPAPYEGARLRLLNLSISELSRATAYG